MEVFRSFSLNILQNFISTRIAGHKMEVFYQFLLNILQNSISRRIAGHKMEVYRPFSSNILQNFHEYSQKIGFFHEYSRFFKWKVHEFLLKLDFFMNFASKNGGFSSIFAQYPPKFYFYTIAPAKMEVFCEFCPSILQNFNEYSQKTGFSHEYSRFTLWEIHESLLKFVFFMNSTF